MLFNSFPYILFFLPIAIIVYFMLAKRYPYQITNYWLLICSLFFYSVWNMHYLLLLLLSIGVNYCFSVSLRKWQTYRKSILMIGIAFNLILLGYYKYTNFFIDSMNHVTHSNMTFLDIILPLGISFFTFTQIAFLVDCYHNKVKEYQFLHYVLFVSFFPHLLAGPILHHSNMMPQFAEGKRVINYDNMISALFLFGIGLFKKVGLADTFSIWATYGFDNTTTLGLIPAWQTSLAYTFQIYFDFSGYTDMAIASALFFNIKFPANFNSPYQALSIQDFWRRWHITLSQFLRDYLYIPLGGSRGSHWQMQLNLLITFLLGGLWHGANWTFVFWGFLHGIASVIHKAWQTIGGKLHPILAWFVMFNFINISWVFFRAKTWHDAMKVISGMFDWHHLGQVNPMIIAAILVALGICMTAKNSLTLMNSDIKTKMLSPAIIASLLTAAILVLSIRDSHVFLYFQF